MANIELKLFVGSRIHSSATVAIQRNSIVVGLTTYEAR